MSAVRNRREFVVVRGPELTKEQQREKAPARLRSFLRKAQLKLVPPPALAGEYQAIVKISMTCLLLCLSFAMLSTPAQAVESLAITLAPEASVSGKLFRIGDIASFSSGDAELWAAIAAEPVGYTPVAGSVANLTAANVLGVLKQRGYPWQTITVDGASVTVSTAPPQSVDSSEVLHVLQTSLAQELGVAVEICEQQPLPGKDLRGGAVTVSVRYPDKPGQWLPQSVEFYIDGRCQDTLPLGQYFTFKLPVVVAATAVPSRVNLSAADLAITDVELRCGSEVVTSTAAVLGLETRSAYTQGARIKLSQLKRPYDIERGEVVTLVIGGAGVELRAAGTALNNAYTGQNVLVKRDGDNLRFTGELAEDNVVVVR